MGVILTVSHHHKQDFLKAIMKLIHWQALLERGQREEWLYIAQEMSPSSTISTSPGFLETSESERAVMYQNSAYV